LNAHSKRRTSNPRYHPEPITGFIEKPQKNRGTEIGTVGAIDLIFPVIKSNNAATKEI
jgi:hypothetical protein